MKYVIDKTTLTAIADSIRFKKGITDSMTPEEMPNEIDGITTREDLDDVLTEQENLITILQTTLNGKAVAECNHTIEIWTFTLEDGTTVEKAVVVDA